MVFILRRLRRSYAQLRRNLATARNCAAVVKKVATWESTDLFHSVLICIQMIHCMYGWDFHPLLIYLSMQWTVLFLEQKESFIVLTTKISLSILYILKRPVGWLFIYYPTQRNSTCLDTQNNILWRSFYTIHLCWHVLVTLPVGVTTHLCSQQDPSFSVRARI